MGETGGLGPLEMKVMGFFQSGEELTVSDIQKMLQNDNNELAYTTVMTVVSRLFEKGLLKRHKVARAFVYAQGKKFESGSKGFFSKVQSALFGEEKLQPILALLDSPGSLNKNELKELRRRVDEKLKNLES